MTTANEQINGALRLLGVLAEGETPSAETSQDALAALNQMIDSWNTERLSVFSTQKAPTDPALCPRCHTGIRGKRSNGEYFAVCLDCNGRR